MQLVIAEKPSVARNIAKVLHATNVKDGYLEGKEYLVSWCIGHLIELASADQYRYDWKAWKYETLPMIPENWKYQIKESTKGQFRVLKELLHRADITEVICATDAGREGELIFRLVYNQAECKLPFKRLWISSMEEKAILEGFQQLKDGHEYDDLYYSAVARSEADWLVGINATRLFTVLYHHRLIVGRVQTPTLAMLVEREKSIENFQKEKYYLVHLLMDGLDAVSNRIKEKSAAVQMMEDMKDETAQILSVKKEKKKVQPPKLYDLTTLQREANRLLGFTAQQTLDYTQSLYEKKLVTYPRTDSQYLTDDMEENAFLVIDAAYLSEDGQQLSDRRHGGNSGKGYRPVMRDAALYGGHELFAGDCKGTEQQKGIRSSCNYTNGRNCKHGFKSTSGWRKRNSYADCIKVIMCIGTGIHI